MARGSIRHRGRVRRERLEQRVSACDRNRDQIIEDALRRQLDDGDLQGVFANVRGRSDLADESWL
jgi:hypothetical protein